MQDPAPRDTMENTGRPRVFLMGLTSAKLGNMESGNLGNYMIIEPLIAGLRAEFPQSKIRTSIQLSDSFCQQFGISSLRSKRFWTYGKQTAAATAVDIGRLAVWLLLKQVVGARAKGILYRSSLLREILTADLVIDFSGDIFGDNASFNRFLEGCAEILLARALGNPVAMLAGSPGPFTGWRRPVGKLVLDRVSLITNREPLSTALLIELGIDERVIEDTACPAFLFDGRHENEIRDILEAAGIDRERSTIGLIISGWNMPEAPYDRVPRKPRELLPFVELIEFLLHHVNAQVVCISHSHRLDETGALVPGPDAAILEQIHRAVDSDAKDDSLLLLREPLDAATTKGVVGTLDMLVSGRLHGAISGLSQGVPTVIIDYGHEPKAHKLRGVARLLNIERWMCDPRDIEDMIGTVSAAWTSRTRIRRELSRRIPAVVDLASRNFTLLHSLVP